MRSVATAGCFFVSGIAFLIEGALATMAYKARYGVLCVAVSFSFASLPPILSWLTANLRNTGAAPLGVPMSVSLGQIGQIIGVYIFKSSEAPGYPTGHFTNAAFSLLGAILALMMRFVYARWNRKLGPGERKWRI
ncbi:hypothetical protein BT96DRAFT_179067 [Gymnopus androsaceus JB14]|uniref:Uncharacterized protein n=1 Tax=Gymnopus androsaceus JB14 TaxID=1447944 RepID=A0A6A4HCF2_9AGAR|nr:hypothetical protein BT96DRAFT_179067 [Gymnopus androsaceus JB14]